jgi:hypothetical protein
MDFLLVGLKYRSTVFVFTESDALEEEGRLDEEAVFEDAAALEDAPPPHDERLAIVSREIATRRFFFMMLCP